MSEQGGSAGQQPSQDSNKASGGGNQGGGHGKKKHWKGKGHNSNSARSSSQSKGASNFKGATAGLSGHVFLCHSELEKKSFQLHDTLIAIKTWVMTEFKRHSEHARIIFEDKQDPKIDKPDLEKDFGYDFSKERIKYTGPDGDLDVDSFKAEIAKKIDTADTLGFTEDIKNWRKDVRELKSFKASIYTIIWGQCSDLMQSKLEADETYSSIKAENDVVGLIAQIRAITNQIDSNVHPFLALDEARRRFYKLRQGDDEKLSDFYKRFKEVKGILEHYSSGVAVDEKLVQYMQDSDKSLTVVEATVKTRNRIEAMAFLRSIHRGRYGAVLVDLRNEFTKGRDTYPKDLTKAYEHVQSFRSTTGLSRSAPSATPRPTTDGLQFAADGSELVKGQGANKMYPYVNCRKCKRYGHFTNKCPGVSDDVQAYMEDFMLASSDDDDGYDFDFICAQIDADGFTFGTTSSGTSSMFPPHAVLIDSGSTVSVIRDSSLVHDIHKSASSLKVRTNGGSQISTSRASLPGFFDVWYNPSSILNILSLSDVSGCFKITMDTSVADAIFVHINSTTSIRFDCVRNGLYMADFSSRKVNSSVTDYTMSTVSENQSHFTRREIEGADRARTLIKHLGYPSYNHLVTSLQTNSITNCSVTSDDVRRALLIYGPDVASLRGKSTRPPSSHVPPFVATPLPPDIYDSHKNITLCMDFFFVQGLPFLHSISQNYQFRTVEGVQNRTKSTILSGFNKIKKIYEGRHLFMNELRGDNELKCIKDDIRPTFSNLCSPGEHVPEVERSIRTIKERTRTMLHDLPFHTFPKLMVTGCVYSAVRLLNSLPAPNGVSSTLAPATLITGSAPPDFNKIMKIRFGLYAQVFLDHNITNDTKPRTEGAIALYATGNTQGAWMFMSLQSGRRFQGRSWKVLPTPQSVIDRVHGLAVAQNQKKMVNKSFNFEWRPNSPLSHTVHNDNADEDPPQTPSDPSPPLPTPTVSPLDDPTTEYDDKITPLKDPSSEITDIAPDLAPNLFESEPSTILDRETITNDSAAVQPGPSSIEEPSIMDSEEDFASPSHNQGAPPSSDPIISDSLIDLDQGAEDIPAPIPANDVPASIDPIDTNDPIEADDSIETDASPSSAIDPSIVPTEVPPTTTSSSRYNLRTRKSVNYKKLHNGWQYTMLTKPKGKHQRPKSSPKALRREQRGGKMKEKKTKQKVKLAMKDIFRKTMQICMSHRDHIEGEIAKDYMQTDVNSNHVCMNQMTAKRGIRKHGQVAIDAILKEYTQLDDLEVFKGIHKDTLTKEQVSKTLRLITLIKEKRCGKIKGRACADGRSQRAYIPREDAASPTVGLDSLMLTLMIDAKEQRDVATADVAGAFLHGKMDDFVTIKLIDEEVDIMTKVDKKYSEFITQEGGKRVMYLQLNKALYGTLKAAIIWYKTFTECLEKLGFNLNPHDPCVANMDVDGSQITIVWYVDDTKISHKDPKVVTWVLDKLEERFGKMSITRGPKHTFVGIDFEIKKDGSVKIFTKEYIREAIQDFGEDVSGGATTPAGNALFEVKDEGNLLSKDKHDKFHSIVAKLLFVAKRSRLDIALAIAYLCTRVSKSTYGDWEKLNRLLKYLYRTINMPRILRADNLSIMKTWVDAAYACHPDMRSHTGGVISFGKGVYTQKSSKQKLNTKSSTESEVVGASDYIPWAVWTGWFMEAQGYSLSKSIFYQDNQSAIRMEKNGRQSLLVLVDSHPS